jgi:hypothetical protein
MSAIGQIVAAFIFILIIVIVISYAEHRRAKRMKQLRYESLLDDRIAQVRRSHARPSTEVRAVRATPTTSSAEQSLVEQSHILDAAVKAAREGMHSFTS